MTPRNFSSGYCARNCNHSTRTRHPKKKTIIKDPVVCLENSRLKKEREESILDNEVLDKYIFDKESNDSESKIQIFNSLVDNDNENEYDIDVISISNSDYEIVSESDNDSDNDNVLNCNKRRKNSPCISLVNSCNNSKNLNKSSKKVSKYFKGVRFIKGRNNESSILIPKEYLNYAEVFDEKNCEVLPPHREYDCEIKLKENSNLFYGPLYPLTEEEREELKKYLKENLKKGFIRKSSSPAGAPILFVKKKDGSLRLCVDYRKLNEVTVRNSYPLPLISDLLDRVKNARIFTKLDLRSAYNLVRIKAGDEYKTAFRTRYGHFEYKVMPFGLKNAPATFQHFINDVLSDYLDDFVISYIDDILVYSDNIEDHHVHVKKVLERLIENNLYVKLEKCEFDVEETTFLGYVISKDGLKMDNDKVKAVLDWPIPTNVKEVQSFIGLCNYYRIFIKDFAKIANPLHKLTRKDVVFNWESEHQEAFETLKKMFTSAPILRHADCTKPFIVETDASNFAIGAILSQEFDGKTHPIAFLSKSLNSAQKNYPIYDKELLAIITALKEWRHFLEGARHPFTIYTDHKNLTFPRKPEMLSQRQIRWNMFLSRFNFELIYRAGKKSGKPDLLSRRADLIDKSDITNEEKSEIEFNCLNITPLIDSSDDSLCDDIRKELPNDSLYKKVSNYLLNKKGPCPCRDINKFFINNKEDYLWYRDLMYVPESLRLRTMELHHDSLSAGHFGVSKTVDLIKRAFYWPSMYSDVYKFVRSCPICCKSKVPKHKPYGLLMPLSTPARAWSDISVDFIVELPRSRDMTTIMVVVDRLTKMAHFIPLRCLPTSAIAADSFITHVFRLHGFPNSIVSDRGSQFTSDFWKRLCNLLDINHSLSTANHPQTDGQTERVNAILEQYLRCFINSRQNNWVDLLPFAEFAYNNTLQQSTKQSPFFANYGFHPKFNPIIPSVDKPTTVDQRIIEINENMNLLKENLNKAKETYKYYADKRRLEAPSFEIGKKVWLLKESTNSGPKKKLSPQMIGPFEIIEKVSPVSFKLKLPKKMRCHPVFHVSLLEPYYDFEGFERSMRRKKNLHLYPDLVQRIPEKIHNDKIIDGTKHYLLSWKGFDDNERSWVSTDQISDKQLIQEYENQIIKKRKSKKSRKNSTCEENQPELIRHKYNPFVIEIPSKRKS